MLYTGGEQLIISTTDEVENRPVLEYLGIVSGESVMRLTSASRRIPASNRRIRSMASALEHRVSDTRCQAIAKMASVAGRLGATAIIAVHVSYTPVRQLAGGELLVITASGMVVVLDPRSLATSHRHLGTDAQTIDIVSSGPDVW